MITNKPNDKQRMLDAEGYEIYNREVVRKVFPRIIADFKREFPKAKVGDIIPFYFALLSYVDGVERAQDGTLKTRFGACFLSQDELALMTGINKKRMPFLTEVLLANGLLAKVDRKYIAMQQQLWYYPSWCPYVSEEGYVLDTNGERVVPDMQTLIAAYEKTRK